jgi:hypothetical protein
MNKPTMVPFLALRVLPDPDGDWHAEPCHPVQDVASDLHLGPLIAQNPSEETPADDGLVAIHRGFNQAPPAVTRTALPGYAITARCRSRCVVVV